MKPDTKDKLNKCLEILDSTDLGVSMTWLWVWSLIKDNLEDGEWDQLVSEDEAWDMLWKAVESGVGFTMEYGSEDLWEHVMGWMIEEGMIKEFEEEEEESGDN